MSRIDCIPPGAKMDALVAKHVFEDNKSKRPPKFSTDGVEGSKLLALFDDEDWVYTLTRDKKTGEFTAKVFFDKAYNPNIVAVGKSMTSILHAVCIAALKAKGYRPTSGK